MLRTTAAEGTKGDITAAARIDLAEGTDIAAAENPAEETNIAAADNLADMAAAPTAINEVLKMEPLLIIAAAGTERDIAAAARIDPALVKAFEVETQHDC